MWTGESAPGSVNVTVALARLVMGIETLRHQQMEVVLGAGHSDVEQATLFLYLLHRACCHVRGYAAVDDVKDVDGVPFLSLGSQPRFAQK